MAHTQDPVAVLGIGAMGHGMATSALRAGIPTIVSALGSAAELPDDAAVKLPTGATAEGLAAEILGRIEARGFTVRAGKLLTASRDLGETHYAEHNEKPFYGELVEFITSGPTWALVVEGENAIATMRKTIGATNPADADPGGRSPPGIPRPVVV